MTKRWWTWISIFIAVVALLGTLATVWNIVVIQDHQRFRELVSQISMPRPELSNKSPWLSVTLGTLGFIALLGGIALGYFRLFREMKLNQLQSEFLATVSHELKTPLATLELTSSLLKESSSTLTPEERSRLWDSHEQELKRLESEVQTLLESARWESTARKPKTEKTSVDL